MSNINTESDRVFYHGSMDYLEVGSVLRPRHAYAESWSKADFYTVLERYRPKHLLAHAQSVFLCDNPDDVDLAGGGTEWMFEVKPLGSIQRHDLNWSSAISCAVGEGAAEEALRELAENYWRGVPHPDEPV